MNLEVRLFARARDLAGADTVMVELPPGAAVAQLRERLGSKVPSLQALLLRSAIAVNNDFAEDDHPLAAGDEVALLPPVSGG